MSLPDPTPGPRSAMILQFVRTMKWMAALSIFVAAVAVFVVARGEGGVSVHMVVATALGVALTMLLGTGLMVLTFLSAQSGHDDKASGKPKDEDR